MDRPDVKRLPDWIRKEKINLRDLHRMKKTLRGQHLHTVCESARCPNRGTCFQKGTATFLLLGNVCTRNCGFCSVESGRPAPPDSREPERVADTVRELEIRYAVLTMVTRDDLPDGGAAHLIATVEAIRNIAGVRVEVLTSDFNGNLDALDSVLASPIDVFNHNVEMVPSLYENIRPGGRYEQSLAVLKRAADTTSIPVKSGFMVGLGETREELEKLMNDLHTSGVSILTIGQYLRPTTANVPVRHYYSPEEFQELEQMARQVGFSQVFAGPLVRSSYMADELFRALNHV